MQRIIFQLQGLTTAWGVWFNMDFRLTEASKLK